MFVLTIVLALLLAGFTLRFGTTGLQRLLDHRFAWAWAPPLAALAQVVGVCVPALRQPALLTTIALLMAFCYANRAQRGLLIAGCGAALNMIVMFANGGLMPVSPDQVLASHGVPVVAGVQVPLSKNIALYDDQAVLAFLGDRIVLPGLHHVAIWSLGDFVLIAGVTLFLFSTMRGSHHATLRSALAD
ncbi:DUF5317 domain-containing protein [Candidatus Gracilibacteria bacterium]|nr:DUF5317 domain-containing protein [Candidatus Gracilibacteria bacterium]